MILEISAYDAAERRAKEGMGYPEHAAFSTKTFEDYGFPTRATTEAELLRYVDMLASYNLIERLEPGRFFRASALQTDFTFEEVALLSKLTHGVADITEKRCGKRVIQHFNHLGAMGHARMVNAVAQAAGKSQISIFEAGPGCGYAGVILAMLGHRYMSYDITQGYYLWQNRLYDHFFGAEFTEFAAQEKASLSAATRVAHLPWWQFCKIFRDCPVKADVLLSNANLGEMHGWALRYLLRVAKLMFAESDIGMIVFGNYGATHLNTQSQIEAELAEAGFRQVLSEKMYGFILEGRELKEEARVALENQIPLIGDDGSGKTVGPRDFIDFSGDEFTDEFDFFSFLADWPALRK